LDWLVLAGAAWLRRLLVESQNVAPEPVLAAQKSPVFALGGVARPG
jgi:hypothetical protein